MVDTRPTARLGMLTPSSNSILEPMTARLLAGQPGVTAHFARLRVTQIGLWNGTAGAWLGFANDMALSKAITRRTGVPASTSALAFRDLFQRRGIGRVGLVTPYTRDVQARIQANWQADGLDCSAERHLGLSENFAFAEAEEAEIAEMVRAVAAEGAEAAAIVCTNLAGAALAPALEAELGIPVYDSVTVSLWKAMDLAGLDTAAITGWGSVFAPA
jgi:maleate isomerase